MKKSRHNKRSKPERNHHHEPTKKYSMCDDDSGVSRPPKYMAGMKRSDPQNVPYRDVVRNIEKDIMFHGKKSVLQEKEGSEDGTQESPLEARQRYFLNDILNAIPKKQRYWIKITGRLEIYARSGGSVTDDYLTGIVTDPEIVIVKREDIKSNPCASDGSSAEPGLKSVIFEFGYKGDSIAKLYGALASYEEGTPDIGFRESTAYELPRAKVKTPGDLGHE